MKKLFSFFILTLLAFNAKAQWIELDTGMENPPYFKDVYAITPDIVIVVGNNGTILKTTDGGVTWQQKDSGTNLNLGKIQFITPQTGFIIGANGYLIKTDDGGETWLNKSIVGVGIIWGMSYVNENLIFLSGFDLNSDSIIIKSIDGGNNWEIYPITPPVSKLTDIQFFNEEIGYASSYGYQGYNYRILKTEDGGINWIQLENSITPFQFLDENIGFFYNGGLYKTIDGGYNFELLGSEFGDGFSKFFVVNENITWGILYPMLDGDGTTRGILKTEILEDGTYTEEVCFDYDDTIEMFSIHFANETTGYVAGYNHGKGAIWKNSTGINTMGTKEGNQISGIKIYPNPASKEINIEIQNNNTANSLVTLTDMTGEQLYSAEFHESKIRLDTKQFSKGIYILSVITKQKKYSQKVIIN